MLTEIDRGLCIHWHFQYIYVSVPRLVPRNGKVYVWLLVISLNKSNSSQNRKISVRTNTRAREKPPCLFSQKNPSCLCCRNQNPYMKYLRINNRTTVMASHRANRVTFFLHCMLCCLDLEQDFAFTFSNLQNKKSTKFQIFLSLLI